MKVPEYQVKNISPVDSLSVSDTRKLIVNKQLSQSHLSGTRGKERSFRVIDYLGYVQIDTISVVERAHHHTFWSRNHSYRHHHLDDLQAKDRLVFEYWGHAASYLPMKDLRFYLPMMQNFADHNPWMLDFTKSHPELLKKVMDRIRHEGPLSSKDFDNPAHRKIGPWWNWKPAKKALENLFWRGELMVTRRINFQRYYDLPERVIPTHIDQSLPTARERATFLINRVLTVFGMARFQEICDYIHVVPKRVVAQRILELIEEENLVPLSVEGVNDQTFFTCPGTLDNLEEIKRNHKVYILSPFDNMTINRDRLRLLFGFDYTIECYTPAPKRKYGYFCLPVLAGNNFIGRLDAKADRKTHILHCQHLAWEDGITLSESLARKIVQAIKKLADFCGCDQIKLHRSTPLSHQKVMKELVS